MNLGEYSIKKQTLTLVMAVFLTVGGIIAYLGLGQLEDPEFTIKDALVFTTYPGATPMEVTEEVTDRLETAIQEMGQLWRTETVNLPGLSIITVKLKKTTPQEELPQVWDELRRKVGDAQSQLPPGAGESLVYDDFGDVFGIMFAVTSDGYTYRELWDYLDFLRKELLQVKDVAKITTWGLRQEAVFVEISRAKMSRLGVSMQAVYDALKDRNLVVDSGDVKVGPEYVRISPSGGIESVEQLGDLYINDPQAGKLVYLKDIADIKRDYITPPANIMRRDGQMSAVIGVSLFSGGNVVDLGAAIEEKLAELEPLTPVGMNIEPIYMQHRYVTEAVNSFVVSLIQAVAIVIVVLLLFMGMRSGLLIGAVLTITICGTFIFMGMWGIDLQRISLGALIIALGMLVDNAIVVTEGMLIRIQSGKNAVKAAGEVVSQNMWPLFGATVIAVLAFAAIGLSSDSTGEYCRSLFQVMFISLMLSWVTAVTITPVFCKLFLKPARPRDSEHDGVTEDPYKGIIFQAYKVLLTACLKFRWVTVAIMVLLLALAIYGFGFVKNSFFPESTQPLFYLHYWLPEGTDIRTTSADMAGIEKRMLEDERIKTVSTFVGSGAPRFMLTYSPEKQFSCYGFALVEVEDYDTLDAVIHDLKQYIENNYPNAEPKLKRLKLGPGREAAIEVRFSGPDPVMLRELSLKAQKIMNEHPNTADVRDDWRQKVKVLTPRMNEAQARLAGVDRPDVARALQTAFTGTRVGVYREDEKILPIISRPPESEWTDAGNVENVQIFSPAVNQYIPLNQVASKVDTVLEDGVIRTRSRKLTITASCDPAEGLASPVLEDIMPLIDNIKLPQGYTRAWGGEYEDSQDAGEALFATIPGTVVLMVLITIALFNAIRQPLIIWLTVPLAVIGVTVGLLVFNQPFGFMALLGFLSLSGMLIKNSIVLIDQIDLEIREGKPVFKAIVDSSVSRMRPVLMAASTTVLGMVPLLADAFFVAMAVTIMVGLSFASVLTLIVVPVLYSILFRAKYEQT